MKHLVPLLLLAFLLPNLTAQKPVEAKEKPAASSEALFFGNSECPVSGKAVDKGLWVEKDGERIYVCCMKCKKAVEGSWDKSYAKAYPADKVKDLKNERCPMMSARKANANQTVDFQGHRVRLCCKRCKRGFKAEPRKHLTLLMKPDVTQVKNTQCPVMEGEKVEPDSFIVYKGKMINLCCDSCVAEFADNADAFLAAAEKDAKKNAK